jgi:aryl-alcohol dehydrogenase-like predicted oxidoreductase
MQYRSLGRTGVMISSLCLGTMNFGRGTSEDESFRIIDAAIDSGINFIDTANNYNAGESEIIVGKALKRNGKRQQVFLATKFFNIVGPGPNDRGHSRLHVMQAVEDSLRRLQTDHIDLYQLHRPPFAVPQDEILQALDDLVRQGKVRYIGASNFPAWKIMEGIKVSEKHNLIRYISEQPPYNLLDRRIENELVPVCEKYGLGIIPYSPIAAGILAGRYPLGAPLPAASRAAGAPMMAQRVTRKGQEIAQKLAEMGRERGLTAGQLAYLWVKEQPGITAPIFGPRTFAQYAEAVEIADKTLSAEDQALFDELNPPGSAVADFHNNVGWMKAKLVSID